MICAEAASLVYHDHGKEVAACRGIDLVVHPGEFLGILGPSGSGKSSLLYLLCGLKMPTSGRVLFEGRDLAQLDDAERSRLRLSAFGFVFQQPYLVGYLSALENVLTAGDGAPDPRHAMELLARLGLAEKAHRLPHELSGGERQRVCVARALYGRPKVVFADEPTAALDRRNGEQVVRLMNECRDGGALVMVTHDEHMLADADRILRLEDGGVVAEEARGQAWTIPGISNGILREPDPLC
ncbi:MAG: ABC transporter ATP-binding protein [Fimbriimonadales bacterium]|nr:ABC transporter ATP-binding protein [Fimbriimonadales bacterium]